MIIKRVLLGIIVFILLLGAGACAAGATAKSSLANQFQAPGQLVDVGGYKMHIYCSGQGEPTIILAAGLDDFSIFWERVQPDIAKSNRVCSYDRAGLGWSEPSPSPRTSKTMVSELHTLLDKAQVDGPYILVGHSFGGALARLYTYTYPEDVVGMVLVDAAPDDLFARVPAWKKAIDQKLGMYRTLAPVSTLGLLALTPGSIPNRGLSEAGLARYRAVAVSTNYFATSVAENEAFENNLAEVGAAERTGFGDMPLVVLTRGQWDAIPVLSEADNQQAQQAWQAMQEELLALSANSKQVIAEKSEHFIQLQQPELVIEAIREVMGAVGQ